MKILEKKVFQMMNLMNLKRKTVMKKMELVTYYKKKWNKMKWKRRMNQKKVKFLMKV